MSDVCWVTTPPPQKKHCAHETFRDNQIRKVPLFPPPFISYAPVSVVNNSVSW